MSFSTSGTRITSVGELRKYLEQFHDDIEIYTFRGYEHKPVHPFLSFSASYHDDFGQGDKAKMHWNGRDVWVSQVNIDWQDEDYEYEHNHCFDNQRPKLLYFTYLTKMLEEEKKKRRNNESTD